MCTKDSFDCNEFISGKYISENIFYIILKYIFSFEATLYRGTGLQWQEDLFILRDNHLNTKYTEDFILN